MLEFKPDLKEIPVKIGDQNYILVELTGRARDRYLGDLGARVETGKDGTATRVKDFDGLQASLIAASLWREDGPTARVPVTVEQVQEWPARVVSALFEEARKLSELATPGEDGDEKGNA